MAKAHEAKATNSERNHTCWLRCCASARRARPSEGMRKQALVPPLHAVASALSGASSVPVNLVAKLGLS